MLIQNLIYKLFHKNKTVSKRVPINFEQISTNWNADPVDPDVKLEVLGNDVILDIYINCSFENYPFDKVKIQFKNCSEYSLNSCNDEGYYYGQYRIKPDQLPWGEFYELKGGVDRNFPKPIKIGDSTQSDRHFIFFFKDETFECLASDYSFTFYERQDNSFSDKK